MTAQPTRDQLRALADAATEGPWMHDRDQNDGWMVVFGGNEYPHGYNIIGSNEYLEPGDAAFIAAARAAVPALLDENEELRASLEQVEAALAAIKARDEEVSTDEGWWIGGAWGDYGEVVVPLRILSYVIDGNLDEKVTETSPDYALTYAEQVARADQAEARIKAVEDVIDTWATYCQTEQTARALSGIRRALDGER